MKPDIKFGDFSTIATLNSFDSIRSGSSCLDPNLARSQAFEQFRNQISTYIYSFLRMMEFEASWLISSKNIDFKVLLGEKIGFDARCISVLHQRMAEKLVWQYLPTASTAYSQNFDAAVCLTTEPEVAAFLGAVSQDLYNTIQLYLDTVDSIADEPTYRSLQQVQAEFTLYLTKLKLWQSQDHEIQPLNSGFTTDGVVRYSGTEAIPAIAEFPGRPAHLKYSPTSIVTHKSYADLVAEPEKLRRFSHYVYMDVEVAAMEVCCKNMVAFRQMPLDFKLDMARQIWDEARHAVLMRRYLEKLGGREGDYSYSAKVWSKCEKGTTLVERLAIEQVFQEGNALESNFLLTESFRNVGDQAMTTCMDFINSDEATHVKIGNFWMQYLLQGDYSAYEATMISVAASMNVTLSSNVEIDRAARKISAFPDRFVQVLEVNNQIYGYRKA